MLPDNDARGWVMTVVSGIACMIGASIICVDLIIQRLPGKHTFRIENSDTFLSSSLSLSFGVMLFSALFSMLPESKEYLVEAGYDASSAAYILIGCFLLGAAGIQVLSRFLHHYIPHDVVDCDHTHDGEEEEGKHIEEDDDDGHVDGECAGHNHEGNGHLTEASPLLSHSHHRAHRTSHMQRSRSSTNPLSRRPTGDLRHTNASRRPTLQSTLSRRMTSFLSPSKSFCDQDGPCKGYSDPCGNECFNQLIRSPTHRPSFMARHPMIRASTGLIHKPPSSSLANVSEDSADVSPTTARQPPKPASPPVVEQFRPQSAHSEHNHPRWEDADLESGRDLKRQASVASTANQAHHHHVPQNAFLSIGLQTSVAIALHKLPEGFITYATNHANPKLGFTVFLALFVHNITEGFAMAMPLYLALGSRAKAMSWSSLLGGASQPAGAAIAALWFRAARHNDMIPGEGAYGCMFAVTAGIMTSVALQLYAESLSLTHNKGLCMAFAFIGMGILGFSFALTPEH